MQIGGFALAPEETQTQDSHGREAERPEYIDQRLIKALGHPVRVHALAILNERVASPNEIVEGAGASRWATSATTSKC